MLWWYIRFSLWHDYRVFTLNHSSWQHCNQLEVEILDELSIFTFPRASAVSHEGVCVGDEHGQGRSRDYTGIRMLKSPYFSMLNSMFITAQSSPVSETLVNEQLCIILHCALNTGDSGGCMGHFYGIGGGALGKAHWTV